MDNTKKEDVIIKDIVRENQPKISPLKEYSGFYLLILNFSILLGYVLVIIWSNLWMVAKKTENPHRLIPFILFTLTAFVILETTVAPHGRATFSRSTPRGILRWRGMTFSEQIDRLVKKHKRLFILLVIIELFVIMLFHLLGTVTLI